MAASDLRPVRATLALSFSLLFVPTPAQPVTVKPVAPGSVACVTGNLHAGSMLAIGVLTVTESPLKDL